MGMRQKEDEVKRGDIPWYVVSAGYAVQVKCSGVLLGVSSVLRSILRAFVVWAFVTLGGPGARVVVRVVCSYSCSGDVTLPQ